jgi:hypothetical protein
VYSQRIRNYTSKEIEVEVRRSFPGHVIFRSQLEPTLFDYQTPQFLAKIPAGKRADLLFEIVRKQVTSAKQNNVTAGNTGDKRPKPVNVLPGSRTTGASVCRSEARGLAHRSLSVLLATAGWAAESLRSNTVRVRRERVPFAEPLAGCLVAQPHG